jgi:hypothetical protein
MCNPALIVMGVMAVVSVAQNVENNKALKRQETAINEQNKVRAEEISDAASAEMNERARAVRRARASARATASEAGINLASGSFLAQLTDFSAQADMQAGIVTKNMHNKQAARKADYKSSLSRIQYKTGLGIALDATMAGASGYFGAGGTMPSGTQTVKPVTGSATIGKGVGGPI